MTRTFGRLAAGALVLATALALTSCQQTTQASAAAVVGGQAISNSALLGFLQRGLENSQAHAQFASTVEKEQQFQQVQLGRLINRKLLDEAARRAGLSVSDAEVQQRLQQLVNQVGGIAQLRDQAAQAGIAAPDLRAFVRDLVVQDALGEVLTRGAQVDPKKLQSVYDANRAQYEQAHIEAIVVATKAQADQVAAAVRANPAGFAGLARQVSIDPSKAQGGDLGTVSFGQLNEALNAAVFSAAPGATLVVPNASSFTVIHVIARQTTSLQEALPQLRQQALKDQIATALNKLLSRTARQLGVHVNPRFGRYDVASHSVVPVNKAVLSPAPAAPVAAPLSTGG